MATNNIQQMRENTRQLDILVVEDSTVFQKMYKKLLDGYFASYTMAMDGLEGLKLYEENPQKYDIIISDHQMPNMDGLEMITQMKKLIPDVHVVFITGTSEIEILTEVSHLSIDAIISKPVNKVQLLTKIDDISKKIIDKRHLEEYLTQLEDMNQAIWTFKDLLRQKLKPLAEIAETKELHAQLESFINKPVSLMRHDEIMELPEDPKQEVPEVAVCLDENDSEELIEEEAPVEEVEGRFKDIRYTVVDKISADDFVAEIDEGTFSEIDDFREDLENFNMLLNSMSLCEPEEFHGYLEQVAAFYLRLFQTINTFVVFHAVENTFKEFSNFIGGISIEQLEDTDKQSMLLDALFALTEDLSKWINIIFYEQNTDNIHYFDASFANTCLEIEAMFHEQEAQAVEDDEELLEFF